ncbi:MAG TPA: hypothetical protein VGS28_02495 [Candidatus Saccharimonadales bacterium]|nr:hypothetical protein [Candidatus Saccharimonadales bacterium]
MGDNNNIVVEDIKKAVRTATAKGKTTDEAVKELVSTWNEKVKDEDKAYKADLDAAPAS